MLVNGRRIDSCLTLAVMHEGDRIATIEGIAEGGEAASGANGVHRTRRLQCGYCTPGQIVSAVALLAEGATADAAPSRRR